MLGGMSAFGESIRRSLFGFLYQNGLKGMVQGAHLEVDRYWWRCWKADHLNSCENESLATLTRYDWPVPPFPAYSPRGWDAHRRAVGLKTDSPFSIRLVLWEDADVTARSLPVVFNDLTLRWERRPDAVAASFESALSPLLETGKVSQWLGPKGFSVGGDPPHASGTLGGIVTTECDTFLISCAHVLGSEGAAVYTPGPHEGGDSRPLGRVVHSALDGRRFSNRHDSASFGQDATGSLDVAIATAVVPVPAPAWRSVPVPKAIRPAGTMMPYHPVCFLGKESGARLAECQSAVIAQCLRYDSRYAPSYYVCFRELLAIQHPMDPFGQAAKPGDSGSWLVDAQDGLFSWHGMIIGGQGPTAFASFASTIAGHFAAPPADIALLQRSHSFEGG